MLTSVSARDVRVVLDGRAVLDGVSLLVEPGQWLGIVGPNGAGKTTLLRALSGVVPFEGDVHLGDQPIADLGARERARRVAVVVQQPVIPAGVRVAEYVAFGRTPHLSPLGAERRHDLAVVERELERLDLLHFAARRVEQLSGGERQRVVLARALVQEAPVLLLDEPTTALDVGHQQDVLELVDHLRHERGLTVVATFHDLTIASRYPDRLLLLVGGRVAASGPPHAVLTEEHLSRYYGARVRVHVDADGVVVVPQRPVRLVPGAVA